MSKPFEIVEDGLVEQVSGVVGKELVMLDNGASHVRQNASVSELIVALPISTCYNSSLSWLLNWFPRPMVKLKFMAQNDEEMGGKDNVLWASAKAGEDQNYVLVVGELGWLLDENNIASGIGKVSDEERGVLEEMRQGERSSGKRGRGRRDGGNMEKGVVAYVSVVGERGWMASNWFPKPMVKMKCMKAVRANMLSNIGLSRSIVTTSIRELEETVGLSVYKEDSTFHHLLSNSSMLAGNSLLHILQVWILINCVGFEMTFEWKIAINGCYEEEPMDLVKGNKGTSGGVSVAFDEDGVDLSKWGLLTGVGRMYRPLGYDHWEGNVEISATPCDKCLWVEMDPVEQEEVAQFLLERLKCVLTFLNSKLFNKFYHDFCEHYLWPLFYYILLMMFNHWVRVEKETWQVYVSANKFFLGFC